MMRRTLQVALSLLLVLVVLAFALTRTEVGRDELRQVIEGRFSERFEGRLHIGRLDGNLLKAIYARDIRLEDGAGNLVLQVDSAVATPSWRTLLHSELTVGALELFRPTLRLARDTAGAWNFQKALRRRKPDDAVRTVTALEPARPLRFQGATIRIYEGRLRTWDAGAPPRLVREGWLADLEMLQAADLEVTARVDWTPNGMRQVDLTRLATQLPTLGTTIENARGVFTLRDSFLTVDDALLTVDGRTTTGSFEMTRPDDATSPTLNLALAPSEIDNDLIRRLVPRYPLAGTLGLTLQATGPLDDLVIDELLAVHGTSRLAASGTVRALPDRASFQIAVADSRVRARDLETLYPELPMRRLAPLGLTRLDGEAEGQVALGATTGARPFRLDARLDARSDSVGALRGTVVLDRPRGRALGYRADLDARAFDLTALLPSSSPTRLEGRLQARGTGTDPDAASGTVDLRLKDSVIDGRRVNTLTLEADADSGRVEGTLQVLQPGGGWLHTTAFLTLAPRPAYWMRATTRRLDAGALAGADALATELNSTVEVQGRGLTWDDVQGSLVAVVDSSTVQRDSIQHAIAPDSLRLAIAAAGAPAPRVRLGSGALALEASSDASGASLRALTALWADAVADAARAVTDKPFAQRRPPSGTAALPGTPEQATADAFLRPSPAPDIRNRARTALAREGRDSIAATVDLTIRRPAALAPFLPALAHMRSDARVRARVDAGADRLAATFSIVSDTLSYGDRRARNLELELGLDVALDSTDVPLQLALAARADSLAVGSRTAFVTPRLEADLSGTRGTLTLQSAARGRAGPFRIRAGLHLLPDRNRITLQEAYLAADSYVWQAPDTAYADLYADAVDVPGLRLVSPQSGTDRLQEARLRGTLSAASADTIFVEADAIQLRSISDLFGRRRPIGGTFNGRAALTGGLARPELTGRLSVEHLSYDDRLLGRLEAQSRYEASRPGVTLEATLRPSALPSSSLQPEPNRLRLAGSFRLPGLDPATGTRQDGALDLDLQIERADFFFFEYLFEDVIGEADGFLTGQGSVGGSFRRPVFDARLRASDGRLTVPRFNLAYEVDGAVRVSREGIRMDDLRLRDASGGSAAVRGKLLFNEYRYFSFDLEGELDELEIIDVPSSRDLSFYGSIRASGEATLRGPLDRAVLRAPLARTTADSELYLPITEGVGATETGFLIFADSTGWLPDLKRVSRRRNILADRPAGERTFLDGLEMDLNIQAPSGSTVHLVFDPLLGDVINVVGSGRIQLLRQGGEFSTYGTFEAESGDYLFTAGEVFFRRFLIDRGTITWDGPPANAQLDIVASYRTRASTAGLQIAGAEAGRIPLLVRLHITERVAQPAVDLSLAVDRSQRAFMNDYSTAALESYLNQSDRETEYATSVLLTNTFLLTTQQTESLANTGNQLAFNSVSQLVASQLNRYLSAALPNVDFNLGLHRDESTQDLDLIYGIALRLLDERLIIRGEGIVADQEQSQQGLEGEFVVEVRLSSNVSVEAFYRREGNLLSDQALTSTTGAGLSYQTRFPTWRRLFERLFGWIRPEDDADPAAPTPTAEATD